MDPRTKPPTPANRRKCLIYIIAGIILQTLVIVAFILIFMGMKTPKVRFESPTVEKLTVNRTTPSFSIRIPAQLVVKNSNYGPFKFSDSTISIVYRGNTVGSAVIGGTTVKARSTKKVNVTVAADSKNDRNLVGDLNSGKISLSSHATLNGKIHLFKVIKRKKMATMNCTMDVNTRTSSVENVQCK